jgi:CubicO group peptidase (beta-lactamase class C family)
VLDESLLRDLFNDAVRRSGIIGAQLSLIKGGEQIDLAAGAADAERGVPMTTDTVTQIGSITKVFNATVVGSLVEEGLLDLDTPVREYLPGFKVADPQATQTLTLRRLLSMASGLDNGRYVYFGTGEDALGHYVATLDTLMQHFPPGRFFGYSNAGSCIAGHAAATVGGEPWETLLRERIIKPAGLSSAIILDEDLPGKQVSYGHDVADGAAKPRAIAPTFSQDRARNPSGACFALATRDLARFGRVFARRGIADTGERILTEATVATMMERQIDVPTRRYAHGWCVGPWTTIWNGVQLWGHAGGTATSGSYLQWIPEHDGVIAFTINTRTALAPFAKIAFTEILEAAFGFSKPPTALPELSAAPLDARRYVGTYDSLGSRLYVTPGSGETLHARLVSQRTAEELAQHKEAMDLDERSIVLTPLGGDRFLLGALEGPDIYQKEIDTAFFGSDDDGRATNVLDGVFAMSRTAN